ncbi:MAG: hypothetical protein RMJ60_08960 [Anaerolineales bacterium]|nr:hypothetical protein [Anaerolineales bacterium]
MQMIRATVGRRVLLGLLMAGFLLSFAVLAWVGRGGAISFQSAAPVIKKLLEHYIPLLSVLAGFYFSERATADQGTSTTTETLVFATIVTAIWALAPPILVGAADTVDAAIRILDMLTGVGTSLTSACLAFYFSKSAKLRGA